MSDAVEPAKERLEEQVPARAYLTVAEVAELARCDQRTVRRAIHAGRLMAFAPARTLLIRELDARAWIEGRPVVAISPAIQRRPRSRRRRAKLGSLADLRELDRQAP